MIKKALFTVGLLCLTTLVLHLHAETIDGVEVGNNQFLIYNRVYHRARLAQFGTKIYDWGSYEHDIADNQLWTFVTHPYKSGCYYLQNERYDRYRLAYSKRNGGIMYGGSWNDDQLWRLVPSSSNAGFYYIENCYFTDRRIAKFAAGDKKLTVYKGGKYDDQLWKLVPRFKAEIYTDTIFHSDNRQGSTDISREISVTTGVVKTSTSSVRSTTSYTMSMEASIGGSSASTEFTQEIETSISSSTESSWSKTETIGFTIPAGKNIKVMQHKVKFEGVIPSDSCTLMTAFKVFESDSATFSDPDKFII